MAAWTPRELDTLRELLPPSASLSMTGYHPGLGGTAARDPVEPGRSRRPHVQVLLCPGQRFGGREAARYVRVAAARCRAEPHVVLDMSRVTSIDAAGILAIASLCRICRRHGGVLRLCSPNSAVRNVLAATGLHHLVDVFDSRQPASRG